MNQRVYIQRHIFSNLNSYEVVGIWSSDDRSCEIVREQKLQVSRRHEKREETYRAGEARGKWSNPTERGDIIRKREGRRKKQVRVDSEGILVSELILAPSRCILKTLTLLLEKTCLGLYSYSHKDLGKTLCWQSLLAYSLSQGQGQWMRET